MIENLVKALKHDVLTAAKRSVAAMRDLFPSSHPCKNQIHIISSRFNANWKSLKALELEEIQMKEPTTMISSYFPKWADTSFRNSGFFVIPELREKFPKEDQLIEKKPLTSE